MKAVASHSIRPRAGAARASDPTVAGRRAADITSRAIRAINPSRARQAPAKNLVPGATITVRVAMTTVRDVTNTAGAEARVRMVDADSTRVLVAADAAARGASASGR